VGIDIVNKTFSHHSLPATNRWDSKTLVQDSGPNLYAAAWIKLALGGWMDPKVSLPTGERAFCQVHHLYMGRQEFFPPFVLGGERLYRTRPCRDKPRLARHDMSGQDTGRARSHLGSYLLGGAPGEIHWGCLGSGNVECLLIRGAHTYASGNSLLCSTPSLNDKLWLCAHIVN
jgi:hypothetical protein